MTVTLIVEDGTGVANANSYVSIAAADAFFTNIGNEAWLNLDPVDQKAQFLIRAQYFMAQSCRMRWQGWRWILTQVLDWPRVWVQQYDAPNGYGPLPYYYTPGVIPQQIKDAQCLLAVKCINGELAPDIERLTESEQVGTLKVTYLRNMPTVTVYRDIELLLKPFFKTSGLNALVGRM